MILVLEVVGAEGDTLGTDRKKEFHATGGTIGRLRDNTWVLPDPYVSSRHALIRYHNGVFHIEDTSTNGVFINSPDNRLAPRQQYALTTGDWIFIEPYEIRAAVLSKSDEVVAPPTINDPFTPVVPISRAAGPSPLDQNPAAAEPLAPFAAEEVDPLSLLGFEPRRVPVPPSPTVADLARNSPLSEHYRPPAAVSSPPAAPAPLPPPLIPEDYDPLRSDDSSAVHVPVPLRAHESGADRTEAAQEIYPPASAVDVRSAPPMLGPQAGTPPEAVNRTPPATAGPGGSADPTLEAVLTGAGLKGVTVTPELAHAFGEILRVVVAGVMDILQARQRIKNEFRMRMTSFRPAANNPLKFSANVDDALHNLLVKRNPAYLGPVDAFEDAFDDLRNHQVATLAGVRIAFESMLKEFDPDRLQEQFDRQLKAGALIAMPAKLRYWESYREKFREMIKDADGSFRELFGNEFTKAYEEQLERLKAQGRSRR